MHKLWVCQRAQEGHPMIVHGINRYFLGALLLICHDRDNLFFTLYAGVQLLLCVKSPFIIVMYFLPAYNLSFHMILPFYLQYVWRDKKRVFFSTFCFSNSSLSVVVLLWVLQQKSPYAVFDTFNNIKLQNNFIHLLEGNVMLQMTFCSGTTEEQLHLERHVWHSNNIGICSALWVMVTFISNFCFGPQTVINAQETLYDWESDTGFVWTMATSSIPS